MFDSARCVYVSVPWHLKMTGVSSTVHITQRLTCQSQHLRMTDVKYLRVQLGVHMYICSLQTDCITMIVLLRGLGPSRGHHTTNLCSMLG